MKRLGLNRLVVLNLEMQSQGPTAKEMMAIKEASLYINDKASLYSALKRCQYHLPSLSWCTKAYLVKVRGGQVHCFKTHEIKVLNCVSPPNRFTLA
jgi:hypothetical protein